MRSTSFIANSSSSAPMNPIIGLNSRADRTFSAWPQSTPEVPPLPDDRSWLAKPTPRIDPISAWLEELGRPTYQVPRFHSTAASSSEKIIAKPALLPT